jgi:hypothetical protein
MSMLRTVGRSVPWSRKWLIVGLVVALVAAGLSIVAVGAEAAPQAAARVCAAEALDEASASVMAKVCGRRVEVVAGRSEVTQVFANPDGTSTFTSSVVPKRVHRPDGSWVPVDTTLRARPDGSLAPVATPIDLALSGGGTGPFATYRNKGAVLTIGLGLNLPTPRIEGSTAVYPDVWPDVDLRVTASAESFRHVLVVKTPAAAANPAVVNPRFVVGGDVVVAPGPTGRVRFADKAGRTVAVTESASMWDSTVNPGGNGQIAPGTSRVMLDAMKAKPAKELVSDEHRPGSTSRSAKIGARAEADGHGLTLTLDPALLKGGVFPLFIDPSIGTTRNNWAWTHSNDAGYWQDGKAWVGLNPPAYGGDGELFRSFIGFPTTVDYGYGPVSWLGKHITAARFTIMMTHSYSCDPTPTYAYRTGSSYMGYGEQMYWGELPLGAGASYLGEAWGNANEAGGCGYIQDDWLLEYGGETMRADVQAVAWAYWDEYTVGLCACDPWDGNEDEWDQGRWKKFWVDDNSTMSVDYNTPPATPDTLSPHAGQVACGGVVGTTTPVLQARYGDADGGQSLVGTFNWQELPSGPVNTVSSGWAPANNFGNVTLNLGAAAEGKSYQFQVQTFDGYDYSPWSPWCTFTVDTTAPPGPIVTPTASGAAPVYTSCNPANVSACTKRGGPGVAGGFTFKEPTGTAGQDVVKYVYGWDSPSITVNVSPPGSATPVLLLTPPRFGLNRLTVYSVDGTGHSSPTTSFYLLVDSPAATANAAKAYWPLDSIDGHNLTDQVSATALTATGLTWSPNLRYQGAQAATFANGEATQVVSTFDTSGSFSVAAWVRLTSGTCSGNQTAVAIDGSATAASNHASAFYLGYDCANKRWRMRVNDKNVATPSTQEAVSANNSAVAGKWAYLVGTYDENENKIRLWVGGTLVQTATPSSAWVTSHGAGWKATGPVTIGRDRFNDTNGGRFAGEIAEVRLWNRVIVGDDINGTNTSTANGVPAMRGLVSPRSVGSWQFTDGECFCAQALDGSAFSRPMTLVPNWTLDPNWNGDPATTPAWMTADGHDSNGGVRFDGVAGYASTADGVGTLTTADDIVRPVLRTDQSVTLAAWAKLDQITNTDQIVVHQGPVSLFFRGWEHKWGMTVQSPNGSGGTTNSEAVSNVVAATGTWVHLVGVFDASTGQVRLYVNGVLQNGVGTGATSSQTTESLTIGSSSGRLFFGGMIDNVEVWQGLLNQREITNLRTTGQV